jgi:hypothetical protein
MPLLCDAVTYPTEDDEWIQTILIGGVLSILGFLLIPLLFVYGYVVRVIGRSLEGDPEPPAFVDWEELGVDGAKAFLVGVVYMLIPAIVGALTVGGSILAFATETRGGAATGVAGLIVGTLLTAVLSLVFGYVAVAAIVTYADARQLGAAFDPSMLKPVVLSVDYATAWALSIAVFFGASVLVGVLNGIPILGVVIGAFVFFYAQVVAARLWAGGYADARGRAPEADQPDVGESIA